MPDGTLIQWGSSQIPLNSSNKSISFPISFINTNYGLSAVGPYSITRDVSYTYGGQSVSSVTIYRSHGDAQGAQTFSWIAIGRWK